MPKMRNIIYEPPAKGAFFLPKKTLIGFKVNWNDFDPDLHNTFLTFLFSLQISFQK